MTDIHPAIAGSTKLSIRKVPRIAIVGPPGSGKTNVAKFLAEEMFADYVNVGSLLRRDKAEYDAKLDAGEFGDDSDVFRVLYDHLDQLRLINQSAGVQKAVVIDSFPRTTVQARHALHSLDMVPYNLVINLAVGNQDVLIDRILNRKEGRKDDDREIAIQRLNKHNELAAPVMRLLQKVNIVTHTLRAGTGRPLNNVQEDALMVARVFAAQEYGPWSKLKFQDRQRCYNLMVQGKRFKKYYNR